MITLNLRRLLVPIDFSLNSKEALRHAAALAQKGKGYIILLHVRKRRSIADSLAPGDDKRIHAGAMTALRKKLRALADETSARYNVPVQAVLTSGKCPQAIAEAAHRYCADLIVMGTMGSESNSSLFFGPNSTRIISRSSVPVLTVRASGNMTGFGRILLPVDLSAHSRQKVNASLKIAKLFGAGVHALGLLRKSEKDRRFKMDVIMRQIALRCDVNQVRFTSDIVYTENPAGKTLAQALRLKAGLIVTMTDENTRHGGIGIGYFGRELVEEASVPVLSIQPEIHEENIEPASLGGVWQ